ncbi:MAG: GNAT family N-acetyltransferase [Alphaproteobacteria bacterium]
MEKEKKGMKIILETPRILLREMTPDDFGSLCTLLQDGETMYAYEGAFSDAEVLEWLDRQRTRYARDGFGLWGMIEKETGRFIGQAGLTLQDAGGTEETEIGYLLNRGVWHCGYASEAAAACRDYAFQVLGRDRVVSLIRDSNRASQRVAERIGMKKEGLFIKHFRHVDMPHFIYAVNRVTER